MGKWYRGKQFFDICGLIRIFLSSIHDVQIIIIRRQSTQQKLTTIAKEEAKHGGANNEKGYKNRKQEKSKLFRKEEEERTYKADRKCVGNNTCFVIVILTYCP